MPLENIFVVAGNHDLYRDSIDIDKTKDILEKDNDEKDFNNLLNDKKANILTSKFKNFSSFVNDNLNIGQFDIWGYSANLSPRVSAFFLNTAICSFGGREEIDDRDKLLVNTRKLNEWIQATEGRKRILIMHHPICDLKENYRNELTKISQSHIDVVINGHTHFINVEEKNTGTNSSQISFQAPQLFSSKEANNGYAVIEIEEDNIQSITFRQWTDRRKTFSVGIDYADDGIFIPKYNHKHNKDILLEKLYERWDNAMYSFSQRPVWIERYFDENP